MGGRTRVRAFVQVFLTGFTLVTAMTAVYFAYIFGNSVDQMTENHRSNDLKSTNLPCIRSTLDACGGSRIDKCWDYCCPPGYFCEISPIVGLLCKDGEVQCGDYNWCRDFADIPNTCATEVCQTAAMVERTGKWSFVLSCVGVFLDLIDVITIFTLPDQVVFKSGVNIFSFLMKLVAFGVVLGAGTQTFITDLEEARCFNDGGMALVANSEGYFYSYATLQIISAVLSFLLAPLSAYYGGKLQGVPYVK